MAAAFLQRRGIYFSSFGKQILDKYSISIFQIPTPLLFSASRSSKRFSVHHYDKNVDENLNQSSVQDDVIEPQNDKYWAPDPETGVFGPAEEMGNGCKSQLPPSDDAAGGSVLEQKTWFRPAEDVEKPTIDIE